MPAVENLPEGAPGWMDLATHDLDAAVAFYTGLFGWEHRDLGEHFGHYGQFTHDGSPVAGVAPLQGDEQTPGWHVYLWTTDADGVAGRIGAFGGTVDVPPQDVPGMGRYLFATDPAGGPVGFWQATGHPGFTRLAEPGAPCWFELWTSDYEAALPFYRDALGWDVHVMADDDAFRYATHGAGDAAVAGLFDAAAPLGDDGRSSWVVYLGAVDVDVAAARAVDLGGTVHGEPAVTPYGRMAEVTDPDGAAFRILTA
ncbi:VOC family protein [Isoptericola sediminis]|uniref:VOC family protein n=1 Tax=Isoptericola sediminis TaxID=2733572 RepID=A0A849JTQ5_9MICO|nr:VOC family protein [Isoptericola sediminis]NNU26682.1 VOC family protein [Isoptericola sediminis]